MQSVDGKRDNYRGRKEKYDSREWWSTESRLGMCHDGISFWLVECRRRWADGTWENGIQRVLNGVKNRKDKLKCLGNAVVPEQFYPIFKAIAEIENSEVVSNNG